MGTVEDMFLKAGSFSHTVSLNMAQSEVEVIKKHIRDAPPSKEKSYWWPFQGTTVKFVGHMCVTMLVYMKGSYPRSGRDNSLNTIAHIPYVSLQLPLHSNKVHIINECHVEAFEISQALFISP